MTRKEYILNELLQISPAVANIGNMVPYALPDGYFDTLSDVILARLIAGGSEESPLMSAAGKSSPFTVPDGYFEHFSDSVLAKIKQQNDASAGDELKEISPLLTSMSKTNVYTVPDGYFETVSDLVLSEIKEHQQQLSPAEELKAISPLLAGISKTTVYTVPDDYFENGAQDILYQTSQKNKAKIVSIFSTNRVLKYAAAAAVITMIAFGIGTIISKPGAQLDEYVKTGLKNYKTEYQINNELAAIDENNLMAYLQNTGDIKDVETISVMMNENEQQQEGNPTNDELLDSFMKQLDINEPKTN
ncbi:MAG: hypothetical protein K2X48_01920 [Chitinophagaceae bacterium]|nr:hypothetical protein [Chitinophagaceae bacterium]